MATYKEMYLSQLAKIPSALLKVKLNTIGINIKFPTPILIVQRPFGKSSVAYKVIFLETRDSGCQGSIRLVKSLSKNQCSNDITIKNTPKPSLSIEDHLN